MIEKLFPFLILATFFCSSVGRAEPTFRFEADHAVPLVHLNIVLDTGAAQDPVKKSGLAQVAMRMLLRGTEKRNKNQFFQEVDRVGGRVDSNVLSEGSMLRATVLAENLPEFLMLLEETITRPKFNLDELRKVQKELEGEILEQRGNDRQLVSYHHLKNLYGRHGYGNPILGTQSGVAGITFKDVVDFYKTHFGKDTLALFCSGDTSEEVMRKWFDELTEKLSTKNPQAKASPSLAAPEIFSKQSGRRALLINKGGATQSQVLAGGTGVRPEHPDFYRIALANHAFGGSSFQSTLMQELRVKRGWTYAAYNVFRYGKHPKHYAMWFFPKTDDTLPAIKTSLELLDAFSKNGITQAEFQFNRQSLIRSAPFQYDTAKKRVENSAEEYLLGLPKDFHRNFAENIKKVEFEKIQPAVQQQFDPKNLVITIVGDAKKLREGVSQLPSVSKLKVKNASEE